jgi:hypothetical protein
VNYAPIGADHGEWCDDGDYESMCLDCRREADADAAAERGREC